jgi:hypothetical protein
MTRLLTDFRKTALIAAIAMATSAVWSALKLPLIASVNSYSDLIGWIVISAFTLLLDLPLPILLLLLYRTSVTPAISKKARLLVTLLIVVPAARLSFAAWDVWHTGIQPPPKHFALPAGIVSAFYLSPAGQLISDFISLVSRAAFILFLVALARQLSIPSNTDAVAMGRVRKAALIAVLAGAASIFLTFVSYLVYAHAARAYLHKEADILPTLRNLLFAVPALIARWIIYAGVRANSQTSGTQLLHT